MFLMPCSDLTTELLYANHTCLTLVLDFLTVYFSGCVEIACIAITALSFCISALCDKSQNLF